jgi:hypothetical protein
VHRAADHAIYVGRSTSLYPNPRQDVKQSASIRLLNEQKAKRAKVGFAAAEADEFEGSPHNGSLKSVKVDMTPA